MKNIIVLIILLFGFQTQASEEALIIDCKFIFKGQTIMTVKTESHEPGVVSEYSDVTFNGARKNILNVNNELADNEQYNFSLDENIEEESIFVQIFTEAHDTGDNTFKALSTNPAIPILNKIEGFCSLK